MVRESEILVITGDPVSRTTLLGVGWGFRVDSRSGWNPRPSGAGSPALFEAGGSASKLLNRLSITGAGSAFCAGADLGVVDELNRPAGERFARQASASRRRSPGTTGQLSRVSTDRRGVVVSNPRYPYPDIGRNVRRERCHRRPVWRARAAEPPASGRRRGCRDGPLTVRTRARHTGGGAGWSRQPRRQGVTHRRREVTDNSRRKPRASARGGGQSTATPGRFELSSAVSATTPQSRHRPTAGLLRSPLSSSTGTERLR